MEIKERLRFFFQNRGYDLKRIKGFNDDVDVIIKALNKQDALCALDLYSDLNIPILGGDVLFLNDNGLIEYTYDSWYSIPLESESYSTFLFRSIEVSRNYIINYNNPFIKASSILFDIIPDYKDIH